VTSDFNNQAWVSTVLALDDFSGQRVASVIITRNHTAFARSTDRTLRETVIISVVSLGLATILILLTLARGFRSVREMVTAIARFAEGDLDVNVPDVREAELRPLRNALQKMVHDVGENQKRLIKSEQRAQQANRTKSAFLANMTHELRTPLNAIIGYGDILKEEVKEDGNPQYYPDLERITVSGRHLLSLINDILTMVKLDDNAMRPDCMPFDVRTVIDNILKTKMEIIRSNNNQVYIDYDDAGASLNGDPLILGQVFENILDNAAKYTHDGTINIRVEKNEPKESIKLAVTDTGMGMTEEFQRRLFIPFTQADDSTTRKYSGTGLGLALSKGLLNLIGGEITIQSTENAGTTVTIDIPCDYFQSHENEQGLRKAG
jgi:signal transduction histidine kinase